MASLDTFAFGNALSSMQTDMLPNSVSHRFSPVPHTPARPVIDSDNSNLSDLAEILFAWVEKRIRRGRANIERRVGAIPGILFHAIMLIPVLLARMIVLFIVTVSEAITSRYILFRMTREFATDILQNGPIDATTRPRVFVRNFWRVLRPQTTIWRAVWGIGCIWLLLSVCHRYTPRIWDASIVSSECEQFLKETNQCGRFYGNYACVRGTPLMVFHDPVIAWNGTTTRKVSEYVDECGTSVIRTRHSEVLVNHIAGARLESIRLKSDQALCIQHLLEGRNGWECR